MTNINGKKLEHKLDDIKKVIVNNAEQKPLFLPSFPGSAANDKNNVQQPCNCQKYK